MRGRWLLVLLLAVLSPVAGSAQPVPRSDSLPRELVMALLGGSLGRRGMEVEVGMADSLLPADLFRDALVLGHSRSPGMSVTVAYFPYPPQPSLDTLKARLVARGWTIPPRAEATGRGFATGMAGMFADLVCGPGSTVVPSTNIRTLDRTLVVIANQHTRGATDPRCDPTRSSARGGNWDPLANSPVPALTPPPGTRGSGSSMSGTGERGLVMSTSLESSLTTGEVHAHYLRLFAAAGWRELDAARTAGISVTSLSATDANGGTWYATLVTSAPNASEVVDVHLTVRMPG